MEKLISFLKYRYIAFGFSFAMLVVFGLSTYFYGGLNLGIDFIGGVKLTAKFERDVDGAKIRDVLMSKNINAQVQQIGKEEQNEYIIATKLLGKEESSEKSYEFIRSTLDNGFKNVEVLGIETVGSAIGEYLKESAIYSFIIVLVLITIYLSFRFEFKYSVGAIAALCHDIILSLLFCGMTRVEMSIPVVAAILTIFGYSVNDTIVIFDRIRENVEVKSKQTFLEVINRSISQSLSRTLLTSLTTLFAVLALYLLGGDVLNDFALVLLFGIFVGTYSSIYIASPLVLGWERFSSK